MIYLGVNMYFVVRAVVIDIINFSPNRGPMPIIYNFQSLSLD